MFKLVAKQRKQTSQ